MLPKPALKSSTTGGVNVTSGAIQNPPQSAIIGNQSYSKATNTTAATATAASVNTNATTIASTATPSPPPPPVLRPHHHRSITGLSGLDLYDNYAAGGSTHVPGSNYGSACRRHTKQQQLQQQQPPPSLHPQPYHTHSHPHQQHLHPSHQQLQQQQQQQQYSTCCSSYNIDHKMQTPSCMCGKLYHQQVASRAPRETLAPPTTHHHVGMHAGSSSAAAAAANANRGCSHSMYYAPDSCVHQFEDQDSGFPGLRDQEFYLLHRNIPALRRTGVDTTGIRQHFYPDGGWGWIICGMSFLIHILTTGLQLSYGLTLFYAVHHIRNASGNEWLGALSWSISMLVAPFVETLCRRKSTRLLAVVGGLVLSLGILFTSFATEVDQVIFSYGFVFGIGVSMVRETSTIMLGNYFKKRRLFVEMVAMSGEGVGIALFSVLLKEGVGKMGWRSGLQIVAALTSISFFVGLLYRPASLYHPQRRAIQHLKNQRKKLRDHKTNNLPAEPNIIKKIIQDISNLKSGTVKILLLTSAVAALGIYTPMFTMSLNAAKEGSDVQELVLLQTMLGMSTTLGVVLAGVLIRRPFVVQNFVISTPIISQVFLSAVALSILFMSFMMGYKSLCILSGIYGVGFGGFRFSLKMLVLEKVKLKFSKTWSFIRGIEAIPVLISVPLTIFLNDYSPKYGRAGYYICSAAAAIAAIIIFFIGYSSYSHQNPSQRSQENGSVVPAPRMRSMSTQYVRNKYQPAFTVDYPKSNGCDYPAPDLLNRSCISLNQLGESASCLCGPMRNICNYHTPLQQRRHCGGGGALGGLPSNQLQHHHMGGAGGVAELDDHHRYPYVYDNGTGSYLRRSLSFIQNANCCGANQFQLQCQANVQWSHRDLRMDSAQPLLCTCSPSSYFQSCKSQSVPEGLSTMSQQCKCKSVQPSREYIYVPRHHQPALMPASHLQQPQQQPTNHNCSCHNLKQLVQSSGNSNLLSSNKLFKDPSAGLHSAASTMPKCKLKRSQSLSRPMTYVEQMTTSV
uniref:Major facilitator superfamily (MFS) profile domain-containing protein n=1 Tax=Musca domestica TaxID=7370 RepID=A0A1I8MPA2_MUSDO